jgi:hypothetical protein
VAFSGSVDVSTDVTDALQLLFECVSGDLQLMAQLLELILMKGKTGADDVSCELVTLFSNYELPWENVFGFLMVGSSCDWKSNGVAAEIKKIMK